MERLAVHRLSHGKPPVVILQYPSMDTGDIVLAGIRKSSLEGRMGDLLAYEYEISRALSRLFFGN